MDVCCLFKTIVGENCGLARRSRKQEIVNIPPLASSKRFDSHLNSLGFSSPKDEVDLILSQAVIFSPPVNVHSITMGVFSLCQTDRPETSGTIPEEHGRTFCDQSGPNKRNRTLTSFYSFSEFPT